MITVPVHGHKGTTVILAVGVEVGAEVPEQRRDLIGPVEPQEAAVLLLFVILTLLRLVLRRPLRLERRQQEAQAAQEERQGIIHRLEVMLLGMRGLLGLLAQIVVVVVVHLRQALRVALAVLPVVAQRGILEGLLRRSGAAALETRRRLEAAGSPAVEYQTYNSLIINRL